VVNFHDRPETTKLGRYIINITGHNMNGLKSLINGISTTYAGLVISKQKSDGKSPIITKSN